MQTTTPTTRPDDGAAQASRWRLAASVAAICGAVAAIGVTTVAGEIIPPLVVIALALAGVSIALRRSTARWPLYALIAVAAVAMLGSAPFIVADLAHPESFAGFAPQVVLTLAVVFAVGAAVAALRRVTVEPRAVAVATIAVGAIAVAGSALATASLSDDERQDGDVIVVAEDAEFPAEITASAGTVGFYVENDDPYRHTFLIEGTDVSQELPGSTSRRVEVDLESGSYRYFCDVVGHDGMEGTLVVG